MRTHTLAGFCRLADRPGPSGLRGREDARRDLTDCLATLAAQDPAPAPVWLLLDGLNQAVDANELLDGLPEPLPANLRLVASTQDLPFVIASATAAGGRPWTPLPAATLEDDCARALLATAWLADLLGGGDRLLQLPPRERLRVLDRLWDGAPKPADPDGLDRLRAVWLAQRGRAQVEAMALAAGLRDSGESVAILETLRERLGPAFPADWARDLANAYRNRSVVPFHRGDWNAYFADSERSRQCLDDLREALGDACPAPWLNALAWSGNRGIAHSSKGDQDAALGDYGRAIALWDGLRSTLGERFPADWATSHEQTQAYYEPLLAVPRR